MTMTKSKTRRHSLVKSLFFLSPLCLACALQAADTPSLKLVQTIPLPCVKGRFDHFAIDTAGQRLFVAALGNNTLETHFHRHLADGNIPRQLPYGAR